MEKVSCNFLGVSCCSENTETQSDGKQYINKIFTFLIHIVNDIMNIISADCINHRFGMWSPLWGEFNAWLFFDFKIKLTAEMFKSKAAVTHLKLF